MTQFLRRILALPVVILLMWQMVLPARTVAAEKGGQVNPSISLEQAIRIVKDNFEVPKEFSEFSSGYYTYDNRQVWSLHWNGVGMSGGSFDAQVDVTTGEIVHMNTWKTAKPEPGLKVPKISQDRAKDIAEQTLKKLLPTRLGELEFVPDENQVIPLNNYGSFIYNLRWQRLVNGVPFPANGVSMQINGYDGLISSYNFIWKTMQFPDPKNAISQEKVKSVFEQGNLLELQYFMPQTFKPLAVGTKPQARLVYQLKNGGAIDALSGEPLKLNPGQWLAEDDYYRAGMGYSGDAKGEYSRNAPALTPEEQTEVVESSKLLSQEQAINAVKRWVKVPEYLILRSAGLSSDGRFLENKVWTFDWNSEKSEPGQIQYLYARVDAVTGDLIGFNASSNQAGQEKGQRLSREEAQKIAEDFLRQIQPQKFQEVKLLEDANQNWETSPDGIYQNFNYQRVVSGIPFPANGINVTLDTLSRQITGYNLNWWNLDFRDPAGGISQNQAVNTFLQSRPLSLKYVQVLDKGMNGEVKLLYLPLSKPSVSNIMDAKTGEFLDWQGKPLSQLPRPYTFTDIAGNYAEKEIALLGQAGVFGDYGDKFKPEENITAGSLLKAMIMVRNGVWNNNNLTDEEIIKLAKEQGWLKEDLNAGSTVSREILVKLMVRMLRLELLAQLQGVYQAPFEDAGSLEPALVGYVALAKGLGILQGMGNRFEPNQTVTRGEAAYTLVKALGASQLGY